MVPRPVWIVARANILVQTVVPVLLFASHALPERTTYIQERGMLVCAANVNPVGSAVHKHVQHLAPVATEVNLKKQPVQPLLVQTVLLDGFKH